jgi:hypothetical protein
MAGSGRFAAVFGRAKAVYKRTDRARALAALPLAVVSPVAGPAAQRAHLEPVPDPPAIRRDVQRDEQKQYAQWALERSKESAGRVVRVTPTEQSSPAAPRKKSRDSGARRDRQRER